VLNLWFADLATVNLNSGSLIEFTFFWKNQRWEGKNYKIAIQQ